MADDKPGLASRIALFLGKLIGRAPSRQAESKGSDSKCPPLVAVKKRYTGETIEQALHRFEDAESEENFQGVKVLEQTRDAGGILVRYQMLFKYSVFDDSPYSSCVLWALLLPADPGAGDPADARFRVVAATADRHMPSM